LAIDTAVYRERKVHRALERPSSLRPLRIAIVSDPLVQRGGAEKVVEALAAAFPAAPIFALLYSSEFGPASLSTRVRESWLGSIPLAARRHRLFLPLYPAAIESFDLSEFDVIISSHHTAAKGLLRSARQRHICYCHTPMRALWERPFDELRSLSTALRPLAGALMHRLRLWDYATAARVDEFVANSASTQARIASHYRRESRIVYPPVSVDRFTPTGGAPDAYYLVASRLVPYKRVDLAIAATRRLGRRLIIVGSGATDARFGGDRHVEYLGHVSDERLLDLMRNARALLFPGLEDFGITPVEMMACGRPVVAYGAGGALETVIDGVTGVLAPRQDADAFAEAIERLETTPFDPARIRRHAQTFSVDRFIEQMKAVVERPPARRVVRS
jgi:glycosyltransferase involved in cell wall biosynthesis